MTTFLGNPVTFTGKQLQVGDTAHDFSLTATDLSKKTLADFAGKKKVLSIAASTKNSLTWTTLLLSQFQLICLLHKASGALLKVLRMLLCYLTTSTILSVATTLSSSMNGTFWPVQFSFWMRTTL